MLDRSCQVFDRDQDGFISEEEFIGGLSVFLKGTLSEKIQYCFSVYDHNGDQVVSRDEILQQLKASVINIPSGEELVEVTKDLVGEGKRGEKGMGKAFIGGKCLEVQGIALRRRGN
ncbi:UNVERIFIED_CONTAM: hypothetical protein GTU68_051945 [Idotea baltica]|nr:hypothetical protein [Idotea baltica]